MLMTDPANLPTAPPLTVQLIPAVFTDEPSNECVGLWSLFFQAACFFGALYHRHLAICKIGFRNNRFMVAGIVVLIKLTRVFDLFEGIIDERLLKQRVAFVGRIFDNSNARSEERRAEP